VETGISPPLIPLPALPECHRADYAGSMEEGS
jgi:hypothetical protein